MLGLRCFLALLLIFSSQLSFSAASVQTTSTWGNECEHDPDKEQAGASVAVAILAPIIIDAVVDHAAASLKAASDTEVVQFPTVSEIGSFYTINKIGEVKLGSSVRCLTITRAEYEEGRIKKHYMTLEVGVHQIPGSEYFRLEPHYFKADKLEVGNWMSRTGDYSIAASLYAFGKTEPFGSATFTFPKIKQGTEIKKGDSRLVAANSEPIAFPADLEDVKATEEKIGKAVGQYLLAFALLKRNEKLKGIPKEVTTSKPNQYALAVIDAPLRAYCAEESSFNASLPQKAQTRSPECAIQKNEKRRVLDSALSKSDQDGENINWALAICTKWTTSQKCADAIDNPDKIGVPVGNFYSRIIITETRNANAFGQKVAEILGAASEDIKKELKSKLPEAKKERENQEDYANRKATYEYGFAIAKLSSAKSTYNSASESSKEEAFLAVVEACYKANEAALAVGRPIACANYYQN